MGSDGGALRSRSRAVNAPRPSSTGERRDRVRCEVHIDIEVRSGERAYRGVTRDLSEAGAFIATELDCPEGSIVDLRLHIPAQERPVHCVAEVRWSRRVNGNRDTPPGLGMRFVVIEPEARRAIHAFLLERAPACADD